VIRRFWATICILWALGIIGLQYASNPNVPENAWDLVLIVAALPYLFGKLAAFIVRGSV
jgi:hypothetical protein